MKTNHVHLHMEKKRALAIVLVFSILFSLTWVLSILPIKTDCSQLSSLLRSKYTYSAIIDDPVFLDDYYQINAGVSFLLFRDANKSINADILMQSSSSVYSNVVDWNAEKLSTYGIAITRGLAKANNLRIGDIVYSRHIVDGIVHEYTVEQLLPEATNTRLTKNENSKDGIILMGYDEQYVSRITHSLLVYTDLPVDELDSIVFGRMTDIVYRSDEIQFALLRIFPYLILSVLLSSLVSVLLIVVITKTVKYNFKRLVSIGFRKRNLNAAYYRVACAIMSISLAISFLIVIMVLQFLVFSVLTIVVLILTILTEVITLFVSARLSLVDLWR